MTNIAEEFQKELNSILESKPPISKAKMNSIVKAATKSVKYYKHVVYYVENFIKNCQPDYKIAGLYVIDAIIRHSRYQNLQNDLFAPRFSKNLYKTFTYLFKCPLNEQEKITKVLQLWKKNNIFENELIEKLTNLTELISKNDNNNYNILFRDNADDNDDSFNNNDNPENIEQIKKLKQLQKNLLLDNKNNVTKLDNNLINEIHKITSELLNKTTNKKNNHKLNENNTYSISSDKDLDLEPLIDENKRLCEDPRERLRTSFNNCSAWLLANNLIDVNKIEENNDKSISNNQDILCKNNIISQDLTKPHTPLNINQLPKITNQQAEMFSNILQHSVSSTTNNSLNSKSQSNSTNIKNEKKNENNFEDEYLNKRVKRSRSEEKSESSASSLLNSSNLENIEKLRKKKALPPIKEETLLICSKTIWIGHLAKTTTEDDLKNIIETYGKVIDIHMIPPRGCAYIIFNDRRDAAKFLERLKDSRIQGNLVKIAWAPNKGIKDKLKNYWNVDLGSTYIPWSELKNFDINFMNISDGGFIDEMTIPDFLLNKYYEQMNKTKQSNDVETKLTLPNNSLNNINPTQHQQNINSLEISQDEQSQIKPSNLFENQYFDNIKDIFDPCKPPPLFQLQQNIHQQQQLPLNQQFLMAEHEITQPQQQQIVQSMGLIHSQQNPFINQVRVQTPSAFTQMHHTSLQTPPPTGSTNLLNGHNLMPVIPSSQIQTHLNNQIPQQQQQQHPQAGLTTHHISGLPLQMLSSNVIGHPGTLTTNQNRTAFHFSPQVHLLQRPIITQQGHLIQGGLIRQLIPGTLLQQFQQTDISELNINDTNGLNNQSQVQLVALSNRSITPSNSIPNIQLRHFTPQAQQNTASILTTPIHEQQFQSNNKNNEITNQNNKSKINQRIIEPQILNESILLEDRFNIPCLMNMNFNSTKHNNLNDINNLTLENNDNNNINDINSEHGNDLSKRKLSRFDREWSSKQSQKQNNETLNNFNKISKNFIPQNEFYNISDKNRNHDFKQRNTNFSNRKHFNSNSNTWNNKTWRNNNNNYNSNNKYHNSRNVNINTTTTTTTTLNNNNNNNNIHNNLSISNQDNYSNSINNNIVDMCTSDDETNNESFQNNN